MKQQNRCFANSNFELRREVEVILPASAISYTKKQFILFLGRGLFLRPPSSSQHWHPPLHRDLVHHLSPWPSGACRPTRTSARPCGRKRRVVLSFLPNDVHELTAQPVVPRTCALVRVRAARRRSPTASASLVPTSSLGLQLLSPDSPAPC
jgi:hypothetical protein